MSNKRTTSKTYSEIEHTDDVQRIEDAIIKCGGVVTNKNPDYEAEYCEFTVEFPDHVTQREFWDNVDRELKEV